MLDTFPFRAQLVSALHRDHLSFAAFCVCCLVTYVGAFSPSTNHLLLLSRKLQARA